MINSLNFLEILGRILKLKKPGPNPQKKSEIYCPRRSHLVCPFGPIRCYAQEHIFHQYALVAVP
jgi:hypothetical protein